jgi:hypothetical protein
MNISKKVQSLGYGKNAIARILNVHYYKGEKLLCDASKMNLEQCEKIAKILGIPFADFCVMVMQDQKKRGKK